MKVLRIHHVTVAVQDLDAARATFASLFGAAAGPVDALAAFGVRSTDVLLGDDTLQLVSPMDADSAVTRYIERRGEGFYTLALEVDDLDAAVAELAGRGVRVSDPLEATPGVRTAFVTMAATHGLSVQLVETAARSPFSRPADADPRQSPLIGQRSAASQQAATSGPTGGQLDDEATEPSLAPAEPDPSPSPLDLTPDEWSDVD